MMIRRPDFSEYLRGIFQYALENHDFHVWNLCYLPCKLQMQQARQLNVDGLLVGTSPLAYPSDAEFLRLSSWPVVSLTPGLSEDTAVRVVADAEDSRRQAYHHLKELGLKHIAFLASDNRAAGTRWRESLSQMAERDGLEFSTGDIPPLNDEKTSFPPRGFSHQFLRWMEALPKPVGIIAQTDLLAGHVLEACREMEYLVPDQVAVLGVGNSPHCEVTEPPLTSVQIDERGIGYQAASALDSLILQQPLPQRTVVVSGSQPIIRESTQRLPSDIQKAVQFIRQHACEGITVDTVVTETQDVSRVTFEKRFKEATDETPGCMIRQIRIERACHFLKKTNIPITQIAGKCGFESNSQFSATFKRLTGKTPSKYRRASRQEQAEVLV